MQADNSDYPRHQLVDALGQCGQQLRNTAVMLDNYAAFIQNLPQSAVHVPVQNTFHMFTPPQSAQPTAGATAQPPPNGITIPAVAPAPKRGRKRRAADDQAEPEDGKKRRKRGTAEKKVKDPDAPKRPPSAYLIFQNEVRPEMKQLYHDMPYHDVLHKISERWSKMGAEEKKSYVDEMNQKKAKFEVAKAAYDASHGIQNGSVPATEGSTASPATPASVLAVGAVTAPAVSSAPDTALPAPVPALATSEDEDDEDSSAAEVAEEVDDPSDDASTESSEEQSTRNIEESPSDSESSGKQSAPAPTRNNEKPPSKNARNAHLPVKPASTTKSSSKQEARGKK